MNLALLRTKLLSGALLLLASMTSQAQDCLSGEFEIGADTTIACSDPCVLFEAPENPAFGTESYGVEEITYDLPYAFSQGTQAIGFGDDVYSGTINIGFDFEFYGETHDQLKISSNGYLIFDTTVGLWSPWNLGGNTIPSGNFPGPSIFGAYHDMNPSTCGNVKYDTYGTAPCREFVATWNEVCEYGFCASNQSTVEIILYESSNIIEVYIGFRSGCRIGAVGIQNENGSEGVVPTGYNTGYWTANNKAWRFNPGGASSGSVYWFADGELVGEGSTLEMCPDTSATITAGYGNPSGESACLDSEGYTVNMTAGSSPAEVSWTISNEDGEVIAEGGAPYDGMVCLENGCYDLEMADSGGNGWGGAFWSMEGPSGDVASYTLPFGSSGTPNFCVDDYVDMGEAGPFISDFDLSVTDELELTVVPGEEPELTLPEAVCTGDDPVELLSADSVGTWSVACISCFDQETAVFDPSDLTSGSLEVIYTMMTDCGEVQETSYIEVLETPDVELSMPMEACAYDLVPLQASPAGGAWDADCLGCVNLGTGTLDMSVVTAAEVWLTYAIGGNCAAIDSASVTVVALDEATIIGPDVLCQSDAVTLTASPSPGSWSADCEACIDTDLGYFNAETAGAGTWTVMFNPDGPCPVPELHEIQVDGAVSIVSDNVPEELCVANGDFQLDANDGGGMWTAPCADCLTTSGLLDPTASGYGDLVLTYFVENGLCNATADWTVEILPVLTGEMTVMDPICEGEEAVMTFVFDDEIPEEYQLSASGQWSCLECPGCINGASGLFTANASGDMTLFFNFESGCSFPIEGTLAVSAPVDASIDPVDALCESGAPEVLTAADGGGTWSADCGGCMNGDAFDPSVGEGTYTVTYTIEDVCSDEQSAEVVVVPQRDASFELPALICLTDELWGLSPIWPDGLWSGSPCVDCVDPTNGSIDLNAFGLGVLEVTHLLEGLCGDTYSAAVEIQACEVEIVNVFSPNNDGLNEALVFEHVQQFPGNILTVVNRWGEIVFQTENYQNNWKGEGLSTGTYYYTLVLPGTETVQGDITLFR